MQSRARAYYRPDKHCERDRRDGALKWILREGLHKSCAILGLAVFGSGGRIKGEGERLTRRRETEAPEESSIFTTVFEKSE